MTAAESTTSPAQSAPERGSGADGSREPDEDATTGETTVTAGESFPTNRWVGAVGVTLLVLGVGVLARQPSLLVAGAVGVGVAAYARYGDAPEARLAVERSLSTASPEPGAAVDVTVRVRNVGDASIADLRLVDGVPPALEVEDGPARLATAIGPGASASFSYAVRATRGVHEWGPLRTVTRSPSGARERETGLGVETTIRCTPELGVGADLPLRGLTTQYHGRVSTDVGGAGVEFYATREYRRGDPLRRIDWNRRARTGELATLELREERAATVVLLLDVREEAYLASEPEAENAVERSVDAAGHVFSALQDGGDRAGIAALSAHDCWLPPGSGTDHEVRAREVLATHPALAPTPADGRFYPSNWTRRFHRRLPADAQVLLFSPVCDDYPVRLAKQLDARGHLVTVVSPDVTVDDTVGHTVAAFERTDRLRALRRGGIRVVDWGDEHLGAAVISAGRRWNR